MKKFYTQIIAIILSFVFIITGVFSIVSNATSYEERGTCIEDHFSKLKATNYAYSPPSYNTCAYVAMSMLLSYYDSYWRDDFVSSVNGNDLDWDQGIYNSNTDTLEKTFNANSEYTAWATWFNNNYVEDNEEANAIIYRTFSINTQYSYLESYLIGLGRSWGYSNGSTNVYFMWPHQIEEFLNNYLYGICGFSQSEITVHMLSELQVGDDALFSKMEEQISNGNPVIYCGGRFAEQEYPTGSILGQIGGAHAMIAYDVAGSGDDKDILLHTGWTSAENITVKTTAYKYFNYIIWVEINKTQLEHTCVNNYIDIVTGLPVCSCQIYTSHPAHSIHTYHNYEFIDLESHGYKCGCGYITNIQPHNLSYSYYSPTQHHKMCNNCIYSGAESHNYILQDSTVSSGHDYICVCGDTITEAHSANTYTSKNKTYHYKYCECGYLMGTETHDMYKSGIYNVCRDCGCRVNSLTDITIKGVEDELESETE